MGKNIPPYVSRERTRHGRVNWYFRRDHGTRIRLPDLLDPGFDAAYMDALKGVEPAPRYRQADPKSLEWLIDRYRRSTAFADLAKATQKQRNNILKHVIESAGAAPYAAITKATIAKGVEKRAKTPAQAENFRKAMSGLFNWAVEMDFVTENPTLGVKTPKTGKGGGFAVWMIPAEGGEAQRVTPSSLVLPDTALYTILPS